MIEILRISLPVSIWIAGFSAVYALQGLTCSRHWPSDLEARPVVVAALVLVAALQAGCLAAILHVPSESRFVQTVATTLAVTALIATVWTMMALLAVSACL